MAASLSALSMVQTLLAKLDYTSEKNAWQRTVDPDTVGCFTHGWKPDFLPGNVELLQSHAMPVLISKLRDIRTQRAEFQKTADRISRLLIEEGVARVMTEHPSDRMIPIETPCGVWLGPRPLRDSCSQSNHGVCLQTKDLCFISIMRSGDILVSNAQKIIRGVSIGKVLIQRDEQSKSKHAVFHGYDKMPLFINSLEKRFRSVILCDPMLGTGGSSVCALELLTRKYRIPQEKIYFLNILTCQEGLLRLAEEYPRVKILTCAIDFGLNQDKFLVPGLGDFGDRYYGTD